MGASDSHGAGAGRGKKGQVVEKKKEVRMITFKGKWCDGDKWSLRRSPELKYTIKKLSVCTLEIR